MALQFPKGTGCRYLRACSPEVEVDVSVTQDGLLKGTIEEHATYKEECIQELRRLLQHTPTASTPQKSNFSSSGMTSCAWFHAVRAIVSSTTSGSAASAAPAGETALAVLLNSSSALELAHVAQRVGQRAGQLRW